MDIKDKVAIVTGGASGLGEGTVRHFEKLGAKVAIFDMADDKANSIVKELGDNVIYCNVNVTDEASVTAGIAETVEKFGALHICNNYAGIGGIPAKTVGKENAPFPLDNWTSIINVNLIGTYNVLRLAAAKMATQEPVTEDGTRGVITNTASVAGYEGQIGQSAYSASKAGIIGMTLCIARDLSELGIRVNTIAPGLIHTPMFDSLPDNIFNALESSVLYPKRLGKTSEIAHLAQYIVENEYTNGETIRMDGGIRMTPR